MADPNQKERRKELTKLHLQEDQLAAIGAVAIRSGSLDYMIEAATYEASRGYPKSLQDAVSRWGTEQKLDFLCQYLQREAPHSANAITEFVRDIKTVREERHTIIHGIWHPTESAETKIIRDLREWKKQRPPKKITADMMLALANKMDDLIWELADWKVHTFQIKMRRPLPGKSPQLMPLPSPPRISSLDLQKTESRLVRLRETFGRLFRSRDSDAET